MTSDAFHISDDKHSRTSHRMPSDMFLASGVGLAANPTADHEISKPEGFLMDGGAETRRRTRNATGKGGATFIKNTATRPACSEQGAPS